MAHASTAAQVDPDSQPFLLEHCMSYTLPGSRWTLQGYSLGGIRTGFRIKEKKILLDAGLACDVRSVAAFITHAHTDHTFELPTVCSSRRPIIAVCNQRTHAGLVPFMESIKGLTDYESDIEQVSFVPITTGQTVTLPECKDLVVHTYPCYHTIECTAYGFNEVRRKLKPEFAGMDRKELGKLRQSGVELSEETYVPQLLFCGDTTAEFFEQAPAEVFSYPVIMVECTHLDGGAENVAESRRRGHMNLEELRPFIHQHPEITFILFHHSQKYKPAEIVERCRDMANVVLWIGPCYYVMADNQQSS